jgi:hypothetical protein
MDGCFGSIVTITRRLQRLAITRASTLGIIHSSSQVVVHQSVATGTHDTGLSRDQLRNRQELSASNADRYVRPRAQLQEYARGSLRLTCAGDGSPSRVCLTIAPVHAHEASDAATGDNVSPLNSKRQQRRRCGGRVIGLMGQRPGQYATVAEVSDSYDAAEGANSLPANDHPACRS